MKKVIAEGEKADPMNELTGITSLPIPSAGINPILSDFLAAATVAKERRAMRENQ